MLNEIHRPEYTNTDYVVALAKIVVLSGVSSTIEDYETQIIVEFLKKHFRPRPHPTKASVTIYSPQYLVNIWEYGAGGSFPMPENYSKISCEYIGKVIAAFKEWRRKENTRPPVFVLPEKELPPKSNDAINKSICIKEFERFKEKGAVFLGATCYDALVELDQFEPTLWEEYKTRADALETVERGDKGKASGSIIQYRTLLASITPQTITTRSKTLAVEDYFKTIETVEDLGL